MIERKIFPLLTRYFEQFFFDLIAYGRNYFFKTLWIA